MSTNYEILRRPRITEKAAVAGQNNTVVFEVHPRANKIQIRQAVERIFDVKVEEVRTVNVLGKVKRVKATSGQRSSWKKAYVTLAEGSSIELVEGL